jgi:hypothetical protein
MVDSSPGLIAVSHVLHRLMVPRHPPCALLYLPYKMLALAMEFSRIVDLLRGRRTVPEGSAVPLMGQDPRAERALRAAQSAHETSGRSRVGMP